MAEPTAEDTAKAREWLEAMDSSAGVWPTPPTSEPYLSSLASLLAEVREEEFRPLNELAQERDFPESWNGDEIANGLREILTGLILARDEARERLRHHEDLMSQHPGMCCGQCARIVAAFERERDQARDALDRIGLTVHPSPLGPEYRWFMPKPEVLARMENAEERVRLLECALRLALCDLSDAERAVNGWRSGTGGMGANIAIEDRGRFPGLGYYGRRDKAGALLGLVSASESEPRKK